MAAPTPIRASTQQHLDIKDILENLVLLKDGSAAMVITTTAVNFGLLSESEQDAIIYAYAGLLNSLTFAIQIFIRSNRKDISGYERLLSEQEIRSPKPENKERIRKYREFVEETVRQRNVLDKKFYIIIPFFVLELGVAKSATALAKGGRSGLPFPKDYIISRAKMTLEPKRDHLLHQLSRLGLRARQLTTKELIQLLFEIYNPDSARGQQLASPEEYQTPIVQPAVAFQESPQITVPDEKSRETEASTSPTPSPMQPIPTSTPPQEPSPSTSQPTSQTIPEEPKPEIQSQEELKEADSSSLKTTPAKTGPMADPIQTPSPPLINEPQPEDKTTNQPESDTTQNAQALIDDVLKMKK